jgi:hypothetical protein
MFFGIIFIELRMRLLKYLDLWEGSFGKRWRSGWMVEFVDCIWDCR